ncbi:hypothetical protein [Pseudorhodoferax sp. Leaf267]|uniref:hypothetical protein n=1 Tax=Pseudorhodoferax sp. Leaf267 TaxID=1736316 RepID=UPI0006FCF863|nr:hypothetical protein [Pseudorhodoferax sp. Leaf267]KQP22800.1 hypothetical protein ASF43_02590 [Pseudorhodoferax sp. Leaf267]
MSLRTASRLLLNVAPWACLIAMPLAVAQPAPSPAEQARQIYQSDLATCNSGQLPAPLREACVREAGARFDRARGGVPGDTTVETPDGRATVVVPQGAPTPPTSSDVSPTPDGRANVVPAR